MGTGERRRKRSGYAIAIYHLEAKIVSRGAGRSTVAAAAYMSCSQIYNDYDGVQHDYTHKQGLLWQKIFMPENAPRAWENRAVLWNAVEASEKTKDSRLAREFVAALPIEAPQSWQAILTEYIERQFVADGMCADVCIHDTDGHNPHAHIMATVRPLDENGRWQYKTEKEYLCIRGGEERGFTAGEYKAAQEAGWEKQYPFKVGKKKVYMAPSEAEKQGYERASKYPKSTKYGRQNPISERWNSEEQLLIWRKAWADIVNKELEKNQIEAQIDHRSHAERGVDEHPTIHTGVAAKAMEEHSIIADRCELNRQIRADNALIRELKAQICRLKQAVMDSIPAIAERLETMRDHIVALQYQFLHNNRQIQIIDYTLSSQKTTLREYHSTLQQIEEKQAEVKSLISKRSQCGPLKFMTLNTLTQRITTLTEETEELKTRQAQILAGLKCADDREILSIEQRFQKLESLRAHLTEKQARLPSETQKAMEEYSQAENDVPAESWKSVKEHRRHIFMDHLQALMRKLKEIYGLSFSRDLYDDARKHVDESLPERKTLTKELCTIPELSTSAQATRLKQDSTYAK